MTERSRDAPEPKMAPLGRIGEIKDIVGAVAFLVGPEGNWVNGQVIRVNGGFA
jgi:3-oxoacyl-[acyl-carrier protein] reductase